MKTIQAAKTLGRELKLFTVAFAGSLVLRFINWSLRWETRGLDGESRYWSHGKPRILVFWHGNQLLMPWIYKNAKHRGGCPTMSALISQHADGRLVARGMKFLGIDSIAGSSSRRGREALFELIDKVKNGDHISITPDGPKGPRGKLKSGVIRIAERSGASIYPTAYSAQKKWRFKSWDGMILPIPFSKAVLMMGDAIPIPENLSSDDVLKYSTIVENSLNALSRQAEEYPYH